MVRDVSLFWVTWGSHFLSPWRKNANAANGPLSTYDPQGLEAARTPDTGLDPSLAGSTLGSRLVALQRCAAWAWLGRGVGTVCEPLLGVAAVVSRLQKDREIVPSSSTPLPPALHAHTHAQNTLPAQGGT